MTRINSAFTSRRVKHGRIQREKYQASGEPFKIAMSFGHDPLTFLAGSIEVPYGVPGI